MIHCVHARHAHANANTAIEQQRLSLHLHLLYTHDKMVCTPPIPARVDTIALRPAFFAGVSRRFSAPAGEIAVHIDTGLTRTER